jgi:hypothetical protein
MYTSEWGCSIKVSQSTGEGNTIERSAPLDHSTLDPYVAAWDLIEQNT